MESGKWQVPTVHLGSLVGYGIVQTQKQICYPQSKLVWSIVTQGVIGFL